MSRFDRLRASLFDGLRASSGGRPNKPALFVVEGLNALSLSFYFLYLFFFMQKRFGFGNMENLLLGGYSGFIYMVSAYLCGRFSGRIGRGNCLTIVFTIMPVLLWIGAGLETVQGHLIVFTLAVVCMGFAWAPLQALVCQGEPPERVQRMVGIYNVVWSSLSALGYFVGGAMFEARDTSIFEVTAGVCVLKLVIVLSIRGSLKTPVAAEAAPEPVPDETTIHMSPKIARAFLAMAWVANPFAFVAVNVCTPTIPTVAERLDLTPTFAGIFCSVWLFSRAIGFLVCWTWAGWHYRLRWLLVGYVVMVISFALILTAPNLAVLIVVQVLFGLSLGLIYYSSLYYSMHVDTDSQGEHGGIHEAVIGAGNAFGPMIGAAALWMLPSQPNAAVWVVAAALALGFVWLLRTWNHRGGSWSQVGDGL